MAPMPALSSAASARRWLFAGLGAEPLRVARHWLEGGVPAQAGWAFSAAAERA